MWKYQRMAALLVLAIPVAFGAYGWKLLRESIIDFLYLTQPDGSFPYKEVLRQFIWHLGLGLSLFLASLIFIGGYIRYREQKKKKLLPQEQKEHISEENEDAKNAQV